MKKYLQRVLPLLKEYKHAVIAIILIAMIGDIAVIGSKSDVIPFAILGLLIIFFKFYGFSSKMFFILCFIPVVIIFLGFIINPFSVMLDKASIWLFLLMGLGILLELFEKMRK